MKERWAVGALAIIKHKDRYLMLRRSRKKRYEPGKWGFVGESLNDGEALVEALRRGVKEETNLELKKFDLFKIYNLTFRIPSETKHVVVVSFLCEPKGLKVKLNCESEDFKWVTLKDAQKLELIDGNNLVVKDLMARR